MLAFNNLKQVLSEILEVDINDINENSSPDNMEKWDSLTHIKLVIAIESEFNITLTPEDTMEMMSVKLISLILKEKLE
jgi:acyl carrier protein